MLLCCCSPDNNLARRPSASAQPTHRERAGHRAAGSRRAADDPIGRCSQPVSGAESLDASGRNKAEEVIGPARLGSQRDEGLLVQHFVVAY